MNFLKYPRNHLKWPFFCLCRKVEAFPHGATAPTVHLCCLFHLTAQVETYACGDIANFLLFLCLIDPCPGLCPTAVAKMKNLRCDLVEQFDGRLRDAGLRTKLTGGCICWSMKATRRQTLSSSLGFKVTRCRIRYQYPSILFF